MTRPRLLDLFGGEGLAAYGYALAGFHVTSVEMGAPWASPRGLSLGIPPAYSRFLGEQLLAHLGAEAVAA
ncbi:hypothetical protein [Micromonospora sp. NPDC005299]|uniref:hypothetical protein n=1 Tax=Micromonospora sp. NPDC005299 TaxID=3364231 RepID=UPI0036A913C3